MIRPKDYDTYACASKSAKYLASDWKKRLLEEFEDEAPNKEWPIKLLDKKSRSAVWTLCEYMGAPSFNGIASQACRLLEKYLCIKLREKMASLHLDGTVTPECWRQHKLEIMGNLHLLIISCIQLATKYNAGLHIPASKVCTVLAGLDIDRTLEEVIATEFEVFRILGFRVPLWTSLEVAELLALEIGLTTTNAARKYRVLALVLDIAEYYRNEVDKNTRWIANVEDEAEVHLRTLHLCGSAVLAMSRLVGDSCNVDLLRDIIRAPMLLISCVADVILNITLEADKNNTLSRFLEISNGST